MQHIPEDIKQKLANICKAHDPAGKTSGESLQQLMFAAYQLANEEKTDYAKKALSAYRSKILHLPSEQRDNDFFVLNIDFDSCLPPLK